MTQREKREEKDTKGTGGGHTKSNLLFYKREFCILSKFVVQKGITKISLFFVSMLDEKGS